MDPSANAHVVGFEFDGLVNGGLMFGVKRMSILLACFCFAFHLNGQ